MSQTVIDYNTTSLKGALADAVDFQVANPFYLFAPPYYYNFYATYLMPCLQLYNGAISGVYDKSVGHTSQKLLPSIMRGLSNTLFANGIDFSCGDKDSYEKIKSWSKKKKFLKVLKKAYVNCGAGGTSLLKINRSNQDLFVSQHRLDTFFADIDANGKISRIRVYIDAITNTVSTGENSKMEEHYCICEERYFNSNNQPCVKSSVYRGGATLQTETLSRVKAVSTQRVNWQELPTNVRNFIKTNYPSMIVDKEDYLPFKDFLGCMLLPFTPDLPQIANSPFGQPIGDILQTETLQYDQMKYFERNEVDIARARVLVPEDYVNPDDPDIDRTNPLSERFYQKISSVNSDNDKITPIQFQLRANDIKTEKENIFKDIALKLQLSASTIASFLNEGAGARTATEIVSERTKTDTWIKSQIALMRDDLNEFVGYIARYYDIKDNIEIVFKCEDQAPQLDKMKSYSDVYSAGNMTPERFVKDVFGNLSQSEQEREINYLTNMKELDLQQRVLSLEQQMANMQTTQKEVIQVEDDKKPTELSKSENTSVNAQVNRKKVDNQTIQ